MTYARLFTDYSYNKPEKIIVNLGDCVQSLAIRKLFEYFGINSELINRDNLNNDQGSYRTIMQGWFTYNGLLNNYTNELIKPFPINDKLDPIFIGFHLSYEGWSRKHFKNDNIKFQGHIGCRDISTRNFLRKCGINSYLSFCNTLTFSKIHDRTPKYKIYIDSIPEYIDRSIKIFSNELIFTNKIKIDKYTWIGLEDYIDQQYREIAKVAEVVYTSRLHVYLPMLAMGVPVVYTGNPDERTDIINIVNKENIDYIKSLLVKNFNFQVFNIGSDVTSELDKFGDNL